MTLSGCRSVVLSDDSTRSSNFSLLLLLSVFTGIALAGAVLAAAVWRSADTFAEQEAARQAELKEFHGELISELQSLAENSGMLTSSDLCPVRFRFRKEDSIGVPLYDLEADLNGMRTGEHVASRTVHNGIVQFGLMPPGQYHLDIWIPGAYSLQHEFEVLPGVPIDRLVRCPRPNSPMLSVSIEIVWPESADPGQLVAVCDVEPDSVTLGDWEWLNEDTSRVRVVAMCNSDMMMDGVLLATLAVDDPDGVEIVRGMPYRYGRVRGISVYRCDSAEVLAPIRIARCVFSAPEAYGQLVDSPEKEIRLIVCQSTAPTFQWVSGQPPPIWRIAAPDELVAEISRLGAVESPYEFDDLGPVGD